MILMVNIFLKYYIATHIHQKQRLSFLKSKKMNEPMLKSDQYPHLNFFGRLLEKLIFILIGVLFLSSCVSIYKYFYIDLHNMAMVIYKAFNQYCQEES